MEHDDWPDVEILKNTKKWFNSGKVFRQLDTTHNGDVVNQQTDQKYLNQK